VQSAACFIVTSDVRNPTVGQLVRFNGKAFDSGLSNPIVSYRFVWGDGTDSGWVSVTSRPVDAWTWHIFRTPGRFQVLFFVKTSDGTVTGGSSRCALPVTVTRPTPTPTLVCGVQPPLFIVGAVESARRLQLTGLSRDNAPITVQVKGPNDAAFVNNGTTTADAFGSWVYTTTSLSQDGQYQIRALSGSLVSENSVTYSFVAGQKPLALGTLRVGYQNYTGSDDTFISAGQPNQVHSEGITLSVRTQDVANPLAKFDLSGLPANARIVMAKLGLYSLDADPCTNMVASSYQLLRPWDDSSATWITATQNITWNVPGANHTLTDRLGQATYTETVRAPYTWYTWDVTSMVQNWVADPATNHGVIVKAWDFGAEVVSAENNFDQPNVVLNLQQLVNGLGGVRDFASSEYGVQQRRPALYITYVLP
jgi:hypothetical protein